MKTIVTETGNPIKPVDLSKRKTLVNLTGLAAGGTLAVSPFIAGASSLITDQQRQDTAVLSTPADLKVTLISIPDTHWETLKIANLTDHDLVIERFYTGMLAIDGDIVDCNDACTNSALTVRAGSDELFQFNHAQTRALDSNTNAHLNAYTLVERLPAGTRVIRLDARMIDNTAVLSTPGIAPVG